MSEENTMTEEITEKVMDDPITNQEQIEETTAVETPSSADVPSPIVPLPETVLLTEICTVCQKEFSNNQQGQPNVIEITPNHYYCEECLEKELLEEQEKVKVLEEKFIYFKEYESSFNTKELYDLPTLKENHLLTSEKDQQELDELEKESQEIKELLANAYEECNKLKEKVVQIENEEEKFWDNINKFERRSIKLEEKALSAKLERAHVASECEELTDKSLYHTLFKVTIEDNIGFLSGLAMGKRSESSEIQWDEFNIALGHLFLGLNTLMMKYDNYSYVKFHKVFLRSNLSEVILYGKEKRYSISYSKENEKNFGEILEALLSEIAHISYHLLSVLDLEYNPDVKLPYPIKEVEYKIADIPINPLKITEKHKWAKWSEAIKYLLIDFKHLLTVHVIFGKN